ncbi:MAG: hypothetical protein EOO07_35345 [Chitinophagaceae bacterium]|nr:MAG: hypothetical protein EOO07_35345 [Chitinophagaceae bacterium]
MSEKIITLCYRKIIDVTNTNPWDKFVQEDSFAEFKMQGTTNPHFSREAYTLLRVLRGDYCTNL